MKKTFCDICKKEINKEHLDNDKTYKIAMKRNSDKLSPLAYYIKHDEICDSCANAIISFIKAIYQN